MVRAHSTTYAGMVNLDTYCAVLHTFAIEFKERSTPDSGRVVNNSEWLWLAHVHICFFRSDTRVTILNLMDGEAGWPLTNGYSRTLYFL